MQANVRIQSVILNIRMSARAYGMKDNNTKYAVRRRREKREDTHEVTLVETEVEVQEPDLYQVIMHNDDFTPMEFVVSILERFFYMERRRATEVMLKVHSEGHAVCGIYTRDVAETKTTQVMEYARRYEYPLTCTMEAT